MTHKVLLADDSQTIQKVIKITLANEPYTLIDCKSEQDLLTNTQKEQPSLVLLDFSLSETQSGYELCKVIKKLSPDTSVLMMYGTFDTVDENALRNCGAKSKIIKPFDSTKFINLCRSLIEEVQGATSGTTEEVTLPKKEEDVSWVLNAPKVESKKTEATAELPQVETKNTNVLKNEIADWGMKVPGIIGESAPVTTAEVIKFPPIIDSAPVSSPTPEKTVAKSEEETTLPKSDDLEYPDMLSSSSSTLSLETNTPSSITSKLVPLDQLKPTSTSEISFEEDTGSFELSLENGTTSEEDIRKLEEQIKDELEHVTPRKTTQESTSTPINDFNDLWAADEIESLNPTVKNVIKEIKAPIKEVVSEIPAKIETKVENPIISELESGFKPRAAMNVSSSSEVESEIEKKLKAAMRPVLEEMVKEYCQKTLEKVAWEVIPDLAENLIKKELKKISDSIIGE